MKNRPYIGQTVIVKRTGEKSKIEKIQEEHGYGFITIKGRSALFQEEDLTFIEEEISAVNVKLQYSNMVAIMQQRQKQLQGKKEGLEDELRDIEFEEEQLEDAIRALTELK